MKKGVSIQWVMVIVALLLSGCNVLQQETLIEIGSGELTAWDVSSDDRLAVLLFPVESDIAPDRAELKDILTVEYMYVSDDSFDRVMVCFSDRELLEAEAFKYITRIGSMNKIVTPTLRFAVKELKELFTPEDDCIIMKNPYTGNDIQLTGVDYVKFINTPLLPVPQI